MVVGVKKVEIMIMITYYDYDDLVSIMLILMLMIFNEICHNIPSKEEDRSLSADYEDLEEYEEDYEDTDDQDDLTEYDRSNDFWDGMMGTEQDKRTQV